LIGYLYSIPCLAREIGIAPPPMTHNGKHRPFSVKLYMPDGNPDGLKLIEKSNWTGVGLVIPRPLYSDARKRPELQRTGIYLLIGPQDDLQLSQVYVGEGDPTGPRLDQHAKNKDFWTHVVAFTNKDQSLNKAHVQFLESKLIELAHRAKRCVLENGNTPQCPSLTEADMAEADGFLADVLLCLPVLGYGFFETPSSQAKTTSEYMIESKGVMARGYETATEFVVKQGSHVVKEETASIHSHLNKLRQTLVAQGVLVDRGSYGFSSPSTAAGVVLGRSANGRAEWKTRDGRTLKEVQGG